MENDLPCVNCGRKKSEHSIPFEYVTVGDDCRQGYEPPRQIYPRTDFDDYPDNCLKPREESVSKEANKDTVMALMAQRNDFENEITKEISNLDLEDEQLHLTPLQIAISKMEMRMSTWNVYLLSRAEGFSHEDSVDVALSACLTIGSALKKNLKKIIQL